MRLSPAETTLLKTETLKIMPGAEVYVFGSRADDAKKGGDIDVLVIGERALTNSEKGLVRYAFEDAFGEQKIDIVSFTHADTAPFKFIALRTAVRL